MPASWLSEMLHTDPLRCDLVPGMLLAAYACPEDLSLLEIAALLTAILGDDHRNGTGHEAYVEGLLMDRYRSDPTLWDDE